MVEEAKKLVEKLIKSTHTLAELKVAFQFKEHLSEYPEELRDAYDSRFHMLAFPRICVQPTEGGGCGALSSG
jgi:hypothetical protein